MGLILHTLGAYMDLGVVGTTPKTAECLRASFPRVSALCLLLFGVAGRRENQSTGFLQAIFYQRGCGL